MPRSTVVEQRPVRVLVTMFEGAVITGSLVSLASTFTVFVTPIIVPLVRVVDTVIE